jgi:hypothetical protein
MLQIRPTQQDALSQTYLARRILVYLQKQLPEKCIKSEAEMLIAIKRYIEIAKQYNVIKERSLAKWSYLFLLTDEKLLDIEGIDEYLKQSGPASETKVDKLMTSMVVGSKLMNN